MMVDVKENKKSFSEVVVILNNLSLEDYKKIPKDLIDYFMTNQDKNYIFKYDYTVSLAEQKILPETIGIISAIYREYIANEEEKENLRKKDELDIQKIEEKKREKYSPDNIFKRNEKEIETIQESNEENKEILIVKDNIFYRIKKLILSLLKK